MTGTVHRSTDRDAAEAATVGGGIGFAHVRGFQGWEHAPTYLESLIEQNRPSVVLEIGSGAEPTLDHDAVDRLGVTSYVTNDIDPAELDKAPEGFETLCADVAADPNPLDASTYDLVFSRMVGEHIHDGETFHRNLFEALRPGGLSVHCLATLYSAPMIVNKITPHWLSERMLHFFHPRVKPNQGVFPVHYSWSRGPNRTMIDRFESIGYEIERYTGYFGHYYYEDRLAPLHRLHMKKTDILVERPVALLCAYTTLELRKPA